MTVSPLIMRIVRSAGALLLGAIVGSAASLYHSILFPWGLIVTLLIIALTVVGVRTLFTERYPIVWTSVGLVGSLMLLAGVDGNGSVLIIADTAGLVLLAGTALLVVGAIAWPRLSPRATH